MRFSILAFIFFFLIPFRVQAVYDPLSVPNNKYGIHVTDMNDLEDANELVNSTNGDWGYITVVIPENERNRDMWQKNFDRMRRLHLIPIVRIATHPEGTHWTIPQAVDADKWVNFLGSLNWPIKNKYVVLFNEPNHAKEWGGTINPEEYARTAYAYGKALKDKSENFFILPAGLDFSASSDGIALDANEYLKRMKDGKPELFTLIDGWTSHSYPNPGFSGSPLASGRGTIAGFHYELQLLQQIGVTKTLPVFITETGWTHNQGKHASSGLSPITVGEYISAASNGIWSDNRIVAITPFLLNYQDIPFDHFSFQKYGSQDFYPHFFSYQSINKSKGLPIQNEKYTLKDPLVPNTLIINSTYTFSTEITNIGEGIADPSTYKLILESENAELTSLSEPMPYLEPNEKGEITIHVQTPKMEGKTRIKLSLDRAGRLTTLEEKEIQFKPPPNITITVKAGLKKTVTLKDVTILIYDLNDTLIHKFPNLTIVNNQIGVTGLYNMVPGETYRVVVLAPYFLPRQKLIELSPNTTYVSLKTLLPLDIDNDGALTIKDLFKLFLTQPRTVIGRMM